MGAIYRRAKIVFNKSVRNDVNMRYFEAMCAGAVLVTDKLKDNGVDVLFQPGTELVQYHDEASLVAAIDRLLANESERVAIGARARDRVLQEHTYEHRARKVLEVLLATTHSVRPAPHQYLSVFHMLRFPDGVLRTTARSLQALREAGDRNAVLALVATICSMLSWLLVRTYHARYRLRHWRLGRHADGL
jgi:hypothetical protein